MTPADVVAAAAYRRMAAWAHAGGMAGLACHYLETARRLERPAGR